MAIVQSMASSFKREILLGEHDLETDEIKIALYTSAANLGPATTEYTTADEVAGDGYSEGGEIMTGVTVSLSETTAYVDFDDTVWSSASFTTRCALIYNASKSNKAIAVLDFGSDKTATITFTVQMPANTASSALIRIA
jgi:uncharacterized membrane-anchored protein